LAVAGEGAKDLSVGGGEERATRAFLAGNEAPFAGFAFVACLGSDGIVFVHVSW
jgi:hypothetical protein